MNKQSVIEIIEIIGGLAVGVAAILSFVVFYRLTTSRADSIVRKWAAKNGFELLRFERCFFTGGFGLFTTSRNQIVYSVRVCDGTGQERSGWLRCGSFLGGVFFGSEVAEIKWKEA